MKFNFHAYLGAVTRTVTVLEREGKPARNVTLERLYDTTADDLWDAVTNPERLPRWFLPVSGELKLGGRISSRATQAARSQNVFRRAFFLRHGNLGVA
jgi:hypothetical protein